MGVELRSVTTSDPFDSPAVLNVSSEVSHKDTRLRSVPPAISSHLLSLDLHLLMLMCICMYYSAILE